ncbi:hypothetical protein DH2020_010053 [Rehmannia glutinosa]|uniref:CHORD domain-containing protein n=1 Tax=Rehmannia glutinosa TaxID=99300 RepID=A0ABR0XA64_REHGL
MEKVRCQRIGCDAMFSEDDNPDGSCTYHDARKRGVGYDSLEQFLAEGFLRRHWLQSGLIARSSTLEQYNTDQGQARNIPMQFDDNVSFVLHEWKPSTCYGKHTTEKPVLAKKAAPPPRQLVSARTSAANLSSKDTCPRCRQGFFCSDHGSNARELNPKPAASACNESNQDLQESQPPPAKKVVDINQPQICKNKGCGKSFKEKDNHDTACSYHPGPAVFHDRMRGWKCCDIHVKEFDEFMSIPPCTKGWHNADPVS